MGSRFVCRQPEMFQNRHDRASVGDRRNHSEELAAPRTGDGRRSPTRGEAASPNRCGGLGVLHAWDARRERPRRPPRSAPGPARSRRRVRRDTRAPVALFLRARRALTGVWPPRPRDNRRPPGRMGREHPVVPRQRVTRWRDTRCKLRLVRTRRRTGSKSRSRSTR
jgi:hypothetical protein